MTLFTDSSSHHWMSFALGVAAGILTIFIVKRFGRRREDR